MTFHRLGPSKTRVHLQMEYDPEGITEKVADFLGIVDRRMRGDLERFKAFIEAKGHERARGAARPSPTARIEIHGGVRTPGETRRRPSVPLSGSEGNLS